MATFWPSINPASFRPCSNAAARCSEPAAVVLRRNPITGTADRCARAANGHATTVLLENLVNSRRLMASPAPRTKSGIKRLSHFWTENCAVRRTQAGSQPYPLWVKSGHSTMSDQCLLYPQKRTLKLRRVMSALCQKQTFFAAAETGAIRSSGRLFIPPALRERNVRLREFVSYGQDSMFHCAP